MTFSLTLYMKIYWTTSRILQCPLHPLQLLAKTLKNSDHQHQLEIMQAHNPKSWQCGLEASIKDKEVQYSSEIRVHVNALQTS